MRHAAIAFVAGVVFAFGLGVGGMTQPAKVIAFLDVSGAWDPSLMLVMLGAVGVNATVYAIVRRRAGPLLGGPFLLPTRRDIDARLVLGAVIFGVGWGLGGFCPGPAVVSLASLRGGAVPFVLSMVAGMALFQWFDGRTRRRAGG